MMRLAKKFPPSWQAFSIFALAKATYLPDKDAPLADCAVSSAVEHHLDTVGVTGSNPVSRTIFLGDFTHSPAQPTGHSDH